MFVYRSVNDCVYQGCKRKHYCQDECTQWIVIYTQFESQQLQEVSQQQLQDNIHHLQWPKIRPISVEKKQVLSRILSKFHISALVFWQLTTINHNKPRLVSKGKLDKVISSQSLDLCFGLLSKYITSYEWPLIFQCCFYKTPLHCCCIIKIPTINTILVG